MKKNKKKNGGCKIKLDLHGISHEDSALLIDDFFHLNEPPFEIVTGNSLMMQEMVMEKCFEFNYECFYRNSNNLGSLIIIEGM